MKAEKIGYLDDPFVLPCVGNDAYGPIPCGELALSLEGVLFTHIFIEFFVLGGFGVMYFEPNFVPFLNFSAYQSSSSRLTLLQQRSPVVKVLIQLLGYCHILYVKGFSDFECAISSFFINFYIECKEGHFMVCDLVLNMFFFFPISMRDMVALVFFLYFQCYNIT